MKPGQWVGTVAGIWLIAAPAVFEYVDTAAADVHRTVGPLVATFAVIALWAVTRDLRWANVPLGAVLVVAPLFGGHPAVATAVGVATGVVVMAATPFGGPDRQARGVGWRGIVQDSEGS